MASILTETTDNICLVTINREKALNTFDYKTLSELQEVVRAIYLDPEIKVVIFRGTGDKAFSAGADLKERKKLTENEVRRNVKAISDVFNDIEQLTQPTIACVNGYAFGGGFELMLACDMSIAVRDSKMGLTETSWGIIPGAGGTQRLARLVGEVRAKELIFTARQISTEEAKELGVVLDVVERNKLESTCNNLAKSIMKNSPIAIQQAKYAISQGLNTDLQTGLKIEAKAYELTIDTEDRVEALQAFAEKREPNFKGR